MSESKKKKKRIIKKAKKFRKRTDEHYNKLNEKINEMKRDIRGNYKDKNQFLSDLDLMYLAKYFPGEVDAPYVAAMSDSTMSTMEFHNGFSISNACNIDSQSLLPIGTHEFVVFMYCPVLTHTTGIQQVLGHPTDYYFNRDTKVSGFCAIQADDPSKTISYIDFWNSAKSLSMAELHGSDMGSFCEKGFVWAGKLELSMLTPKANLIGKAWKGRIGLGQLFDNGTDTAQLKYISVNQLIRVAQELEDTLDGEFELKSAVVNHNIPYHNETRPDFITTTGQTEIPTSQIIDQLTSENFNGEYMEYIVIQRGAAAITSPATPYTYSLACTASCNAAFWPLMTDAIANNLYRNNQLKESYERLVGKSILTEQAVNNTAEVVSKTPSFTSWLNGVNWQSVLNNGIKMAKGAFEAYNGNPIGIGEAITYGADLVSTLGGKARKPPKSRKIDNKYRFNHPSSKYSLKLMEPATVVNEYAGVGTRVGASSGGHWIFLGTLRLRVNQARQLGKVGWDEVDDIIEKIDTNINLLRTKLIHLPNRYFVKDKKKDLPSLNEELLREKEKIDRTRLEELSRIGMKTESEVSEFRDLLNKY